MFTLNRTPWQSALAAAQWNALRAERATGNPRFNGQGIIKEKREIARGFAAQRNFSS
jgi:hypothetical protein